MLTKQDIYKYLVKECGLSFEQIADLNSDQIHDILCRPDPKPLTLSGD